MESHVNYTRIGLFVVILTAAMISMALWLSNYFTKTNIYHPYVTYLKGSVAGLNANASVKFNGVPIGFVEQIEIDKQLPTQVKLTLQIQADTPITQGTIAFLKTQGLTGIAYIELEPRSLNNQLLLPSDHPPFPIIPSDQSFFGDIQEKIDTLIEKFNTLSENLNTLLAQENQEYIKKSLADLSHVLSYFRTISHNTEIASQQFPTAIADIERSSHAFEKMTKHIEQTNVQVAKTIKNSELAIELFSTQVMPSALNLLAKLNISANQFNALSAELLANPSALIRGRALQMPGPGETSAQDPSS